MTEDEANAFALAQVGDWTAFAAAQQDATRAAALPGLARAHGCLETIGERSHGWRSFSAGLGTDLLLALRVLRAQPGCAAVALGVLALAIGAATAIFSVVDAVVLRSLPFDDSNRILAVVEHDPKRVETLGGGLTSAPTYLDWRHHQSSFEGLAAVGNTAFRSRTPSGEPSAARAQSVTWEFFQVLRAAPLLGRVIRADDEIRGRHHVVVLGHAFWQRQFGGAPDVVGRTVDLDEQRWQIVGVMPPGFTYSVAGSRPTDLYVPLAFDEAECSRDSGQSFAYTAIGRLKPGVTLAQAGDQMGRMAAGLDRQYPTWTPGRTARVVSLQDRLVGRVRSWMLMLLAAGALGWTSSVPSRPRPSTSRLVAGRTMGWGDVAVIPACSRPSCDAPPARATQPG
ncbi:MAG TPA: ABC transporter permease [Vicinamibacterales bacterium]|jgi:putative ABC transport system permease protein